MGDRVPRSGMTAPAFPKPAFGRRRRRPWRRLAGAPPAVLAPGGRYARDVVSYVEAAALP